MTPAEQAAFRSHPQFEAAVAVREYDDRAKVVGRTTPPFAHFRRYLEASLRADPLVPSPGFAGEG